MRVLWYKYRNTLGVLGLVLSAPSDGVLVGAACPPAALEEPSVANSKLTTSHQTRQYFALETSVDCFRKLGKLPLVLVQKGSLISGDADPDGWDDCCKLPFGRKCFVSLELSWRRHHKTSVVFIRCRS